MMRVAPDAYTVGKRLYASAESQVHEAVRDADGACVVIKSYAADRSTDPKPRAEREFDAMRRAEGCGIPRALALDRTTEQPLLILEQVPGIPLLRLLENEPLEIRTGLALAVRLAETLAQLHALRLLHKDLNPNNVLVDLATGQTWVIDFGLAAELGAAQTSVERAEALEGTLRYIAPEQTGWINRGCDPRSDLYSLGATLYHVWTGQPPFLEADQTELIHAHIARVPRAPRELRPELPEALSQLVLKLLRKEPEERYQSARALHTDLLACSERLEREGHIDPEFKLGSADAPDRPRFASKPRGREREIAQLHAACARAARGQIQAILLTGEAGSGKSTLVEELRPVIAERRGYLAAAKFDAYRDRPYAGWAAALGALAQQLLVESDARLARWRSELREALGNIAHALIDLVPDLTFVLGDVPAVPPLGPRETQERLSLALQRFVAVFTGEHPLVLFLDDLQWSDAGSRALLEGVLTSDVSAALLLIGAYRGSDVGDAHELEALFGPGHAAEIIDIGPLGIEAAVAMLAEALERPPAEVRRLAECVMRKTGGSPLLIQQFVLHMHALGLIRFASDWGWTWNDAAIAGADIPDGAVAFMVAKLERLPAPARELAEFASCVGDAFDIELLAELSGKSRDALEAPLFLLAEESLISVAPNGFRFAHDRIREAAQSLLSDDELARVHHDAGRLLLERSSEAQRDERVFEIVEHLNRGRRFLLEEQRLLLLELNVLAGKRALAAGAGTTAAGYLDVALGLFREDDWTARRELGLDLYLQKAESSFQTGEHAASLSVLEGLERRSSSPLELARIASKRVQVFALLRESEDCARYVLEVLRQLGVRWPLRPSRLRARVALAVVRFLLRGDSVPTFRPAAGTADPRRLGALLVLAAGSGVLSRMDSRLQLLLTCLILRHYRWHGYLRSPAFLLASYAFCEQVFRDNHARAQHLARQALEWCERVPDPVYAPRAHCIVHAMIQPWVLRRRHALEPMERIARLAREVGDREFAHYARFLNLYFRALAGAPVSEAPRSLRELASSYTTGLLHREANAAANVTHMLAELHSGDIETKLAASDQTFRTHPGDGEPYIRTLWMLVLCVYGRHDLAFAQSEALGDRLVRLTPFVHIADHAFYRGLAGAALAGAEGAWSGRRHRRALERSLRSLRGWARHGPDFAHMMLFLEAERERLRGRVAWARSLYEHAAERAIQQEFAHHGALAHERRARMLLELRRETEACAALREAQALYMEWGALPKAEAITQELHALGTS